MNEDSDNQEQLVQPETEQTQQPEEAPVENTEAPAEVTEDSEVAESDETPVEQDKLFTKDEVTKIVAQTVARKQRSYEKQQAVLQQFDAPTAAPVAAPQSEPQDYQQPTYQPPAQQQNRLQAVARAAGISDKDIARVAVQQEELMQSNPSLFTDYANNIVQPLGEPIAARLLSVATTFDGGLEKISRLSQTEEGRNKLYEIARIDSFPEQVTKTAKLIENYGKKPNPIIPNRGKLANTKLPPSDNASAKSYENMSVRERLVRMAGS